MTVKLKAVATPLQMGTTNIFDLNAASITETVDPVANARCDWWQKKLDV